MDTRLTEEQQLIQDTAAKLCAELGPNNSAELPGEGDGRTAWARLAATGLLGMRLPEAVGGSALSGVETALVAEQFGRFCVPLPFIGSAVCASELLLRAGASPDVLSKLASGELRLAPVLDARMQDWANPGQPGIAFDCRGADAGLVLDRGTRRLSAVVLGPLLNSQDLTRELRSVAADATRLDVGDLGAALSDEAMDSVLSATLMAIAADLVGVMQAALDLAVSYTAQREQFGVKVGSFQALQHLAAEAEVSTEAARGCAYYAAWALDALPVKEALEAAHTAKAYASQHARDVCETAIQMHGGIGMTWEAMPHVYLRRSLVGRLTLGDENTHHARLASMRLSQSFLSA
jgi:alkylation response protein AidB-like acyl-CoA dehydrogenase